MLLCPHCKNEFLKATQYYEDVKDTAFHVRNSTNQTELKMLVVEHLLSNYKLVREYICFEHSGFPREQAEKWWRERSILAHDVPKTADEALALRGFITPVSVIGIQEKDGFCNVVEARSKSGFILTKENKKTQEQHV